MRKSDARLFGTSQPSVIAFDIASLSLSLCIAAASVRQVFGHLASFLVSKL
jgi:hypothetical protein